MVFVISPGGRGDGWRAGATVSRGRNMTWHGGPSWWGCPSAIQHLGGRVVSCCAISNVLHQHVVGILWGVMCALLPQLS